MAEEEITEEQYRARVESELDYEQTQEVQLKTKEQHNAEG